MVIRARVVLLVRATVEHRGSRGRSVSSRPVARRGANAELARVHLTHERAALGRS